MMRKLRLFWLGGLLAFTLSACWNDTKTESWTGEIATWAQLSWMMLPANEDQSSFSWVAEHWALTGENSLSGAKTPSQAWFPVELCNQIVAFNLCVISKAPIENQPVMKEQLIKVLEPWRLLADSQLREVCQQISVQESFLEVVKHYEIQGCKF